MFDLRSVVLNGLLVGEDVTVEASHGLVVTRATAGGGDVPPAPWNATRSFVVTGTTLVRSDDTGLVVKCGGVDWVVLWEDIGAATVGHLRCVLIPSDPPVGQIRRVGHLTVHQGGGSLCTRRR